ncbi:MAG: YceI family protein [Nocardioidaceae bacterium]|nr:YceI family protein [Nocardioidaceae bacterium]
MTLATQPFTGTFVADPDHSSFQFAVSHMVGTFRASFDDVDARVIVDDRGIRFEGAARVESVSITTPPELREHVVNGAEFFDAKNHPQITFHAEDAQLDDDGRLNGEGELTIRGVTRPVTATGTYRGPVENPYGQTVAAVELTTTVDRRDWGMDWQMAMPAGGDVLGYDVEVTAKLDLVQEG